MIRLGLIHLFIRLGLIRLFRNLATPLSRL
jgi:hypothetical protein